MVKKLRLWICLLLLACFLLSLLISEDVQADEYKNLPVKGMVTMIDLEAKKCIPCKMMAPIMEKMKKVYKGKALEYIKIRLVKQIEKSLQPH